MGQLDGRKILVTGASSGIGAATARALAAEGARVAVVARRETELVDVADDIGGSAHPADLRDVAASQLVVADAADALGGLDAVVNNAGVALVGTVADGDPEDWRTMLELNVLATLTVTQAALEHLRASSHGHVVNVSSMSGRRVPSATGGIYGASKAAVHALSEGLRREVAEDGIAVTVVAPGLVDTDLLTGVDGEAAASLAERLGDGLAPDDVAAAIVHALTRPPGVCIREIAVAATSQGS